MFFLVRVTVAIVAPVTYDSKHQKHIDRQKYTKFIFLYDSLLHDYTLQAIQQKSATRNLHEGFKLGHVTKATNDIKEVS